MPARDRGRADSARVGNGTVIAFEIPPESEFRGVFETIGTVTGIVCGRFVRANRSLAV